MADTLQHGLKGGLIYTMPIALLPIPKEVLAVIFAWGFFEGVYVDLRGKVGDDIHGWMHRDFESGEFEMKYKFSAIVRNGLGARWHQQEDIAYHSVPKWWPTFAVSEIGGLLLSLIGTYFVFFHAAIL
jgi:hypothetical protein